MADITYTSEDGETTFDASTPRGEAFLGGKTLTLSSSVAAAFMESGKSEGVTFEAFP